MAAKKSLNSMQDRRERQLLSGRVHNMHQDARFPETRRLKAGASAKEIPCGYKSSCEGCPPSGSWYEGPNFDLRVAP
jgi:hypothetical protein